MRTVERLDPLTISRPMSAGRYCDGLGLWLQVSPGGTKSWLFRYMRDGRARQMGLGPFHTVGLARARELALEARQMLHAGKDPIDARNKRKIEDRREAARAVVFQTCAEQMIASHEIGWRNAKHRQQWRNTLRTYAYPFLGTLPIADVSTQDVLKVLQQPTPTVGGREAPLWSVKTETASRVRGRIEAVLSYAKAQGKRAGENPAAWRGHLDQLLPRRSRVRRVEHHAALPYRNLPAFMAELSARDSISARALEFAILTACRTGEVVGARWDEVDTEERVWRVPGERMKAGKPHSVPLSDAALVMLAGLPRIEGSPYLFPGYRNGRSLSNMAMAQLLKGMRPGLTVHGFRSTFRDWAAEKTAHPAWVAEAALAHVVADKVEAAYRRGELIEKRQLLMADWAAFCSSGRQRLTDRADCALPLRPA